jgi:outer membrane lipoprotein-sorting protein
MLLNNYRNSFVRNPIVGAFFVLSSFFYSCAALAEDAAAKGLAIATEMSNRDSGWKDSTATMHMALINSSGKRTERELRLQTLEGVKDGDKGLTTFDSPKDVQGTAFLSFSHAVVADEQWLYLPALKRVKRISSANKSGPFMGSEFAFEDLSSNEVEKYKYELLREEKLDGMDCFVVRNFPLYEHSGYLYRDVWVDKEHYRVHKVDFYDRKGSLLKTLTQKNYQKYLDKYWRADQFVVVNHQTKKSTELTWKDYKFNTGLSEADFDRNSLMRAK